MTEKGGGGLLTLILGKKRKKNTEAVLGQIAEAVRARQDGQILIVPEQFSHDAERALCAACGDSVSLYAEVLSFTRLAARVSALYGGAARETLDNGGRLTALALALQYAQPRLKIYAAARTRPELIVQLGAQIEEFRSYGVRPDDLRAASGQFFGAFAQKLEELALILDSYDAVCKAGRADPASRLEQLCEQLWETDFLAGKTICLDGFTDFTGLQMAILRVLLRRGCDVTVSLVCDDAVRGAAVYDAARATAGWLLRCAKDAEHPCRVHTLPQEGDAFLQEHLFAHDTAACKRTDFLTLGRAATPAVECELAVSRVRALLMDGYRCGEIAVACTNREPYYPLLRQAFAHCGIPAYWSGREDILREPTLSGLLAALQSAVGGMEAEDVFSYLRSPLGTLPRDACDRLENYVKRWNIRGSRWEQDFTMHPDGYGLELDVRAQERLHELNAWRQAAAAPLTALRRGLSDAANTGAQVLALHAFLTEIGTEERLRELRGREDIPAQRRQEFDQLYDICIAALEQLYLVLGETVRTPDDFAAMLRQLLRQYSLGTIPASLDSVTVGTLPDLRHQQKRAILLLGAGDGLLPQLAGETGILSDQERRLLQKKTDLTLAPDRNGRLERELAGIYDVVCAAEERLYVSYAGDSPSYLYRRLAALYPNAPVCEPEGPLLAGSRDAGAYLAAAGEEDALARRLRALRRPEVTEAETALRSRAAYMLGTLGQEAVSAIYQPVLQLSASRIDQLSACRCAYFLRYGLHAEEQKEAAVDAPVFGTFVHAVLERSARRTMEEGGYAAVLPERQQAILEEEIANAAAEQFGAGDAQEPRFRYLMERNLAEVREVADCLSAELRGAEFQPRAFELSFGGADGTLPPVSVHGRRAEARVVGFVDRVDLYETPERSYVRVVDYKTGQKKFSYSDVLHGMGMQMLLYLFALEEHGALLWGRAPQPAGVLYVPARAQILPLKARPNGEDAAAEREKEMRRSGLLLDDERVLEAMERTEDGTTRFLPCKPDKDGELRGYLASPEQLALLRRHVWRTMERIADEIAGGNLRPNPYFQGSEQGACRFCQFAPVCHLDSCDAEKRYFSAKKETEFWKILEENDHG